MGTYKNLVKTRYVNDKQITDHYAIIPTGQGLSALSSVSQAARNVYDCVVKRFFEYFLSARCISESSGDCKDTGGELFLEFKVLAEEGYLKVAGIPQNAGEQSMDPQFFQVVQNLKKGGSPAGLCAGCEGRRDFSAEALQFRIHDPCNGKRGAVDRG